MSSLFMWIDWLILGLAIGAFAAWRWRGKLPGGLVGPLAGGALGAVLGGLIYFLLIGLFLRGGIGAFDVRSLAAALLGAILVVGLLRAVGRGEQATTQQAMLE